MNSPFFKTLLLIFLLRQTVIYLQHIFSFSIMNIQGADMEVINLAGSQSLIVFVQMDYQPTIWYGWQFLFHVDNLKIRSLTVGNSIVSRFKSNNEFHDIWFNNLVCCPFGQLYRFGSQMGIDETCNIVFTN